MKQDRRRSESTARQKKRKHQPNKPTKKATETSRILEVKRKGWNTTLYASQPLSCRVLLASRWTTIVFRDQPHMQPKCCIAVGDISLQGFQLRAETDLHRATDIASIAVLNGTVMKIDIHLALKGMFCTIHWTAGGCDWPSKLLFHTSCSPDHISKHVCGCVPLRQLLGYPRTASPSSAKGHFLHPGGRKLYFHISWIAPTTFFFQRFTGNHFDLNICQPRFLSYHHFAALAFTLDS